jgi:hypothetical protein
MDWGDRDGHYGAAGAVPSPEYPWLRTDPVPGVIGKWGLQPGR